MSAHCNNFKMITGIGGNEATHSIMHIILYYIYVAIKHWTLFTYEATHIRTVAIILKGLDRTLFTYGSCVKHLDNPCGEEEERAIVQYFYSAQTYTTMVGCVSKSA
jgi:hypothetical protein